MEFLVLFQFHIIKHFLFLSLYRNIDFFVLYFIYKALFTGNALINVGPTKEGTIAPIFQERLLALGEWLSINGEAIYGTSPWIHQNDTVNGNVWYTCVKTKYNGRNPTSRPRESDTITATYAIFLEWPKNNILQVGDIAPYLHTGTYDIKMLGEEESLKVG